MAAQDDPGTTSAPVRASALAWVGDIERETLGNDSFRTVLHTGAHAQLTVMRLQAGEEIGWESHPHLDQFLRIEHGRARLDLGRSGDGVDEQHELADDWAIVVPAGVWHNIVNTSDGDVKLYSLYAPPEHPAGTVHATKAEADAAEHDHRGVSGAVEPGEAAEGDPLGNVVWHALTSVHARFAEGRGGARRYQADVSVFAGVPATDEAGWAALGELVGPGGHATLFRADLGDPPPGWTVAVAGVGDQLVLDRPPAEVALPPGTRPLGRDDAAAMAALVALTEPGPFTARTVELGGYLGVVEDGRLLAMAGRRMALPGHVEVSAVCTHPDARGRGYAAALTAAVARGIAAEGATSFLHVVVGNDAARRVYERLGFTPRRQVRFAVLRAPAAP